MDIPPADYPADYAGENGIETPVIIRQSELLNLTVIARDSLEEVGRVDRLWMYPQAHRVLGIVCQRGGLFRKQQQVYKLPQVHSLNQDNLWVNGPGQETSSEKLRQLQSLIDHDVWVDGGDRLGRITDCLFNRKTGEITQYLFADNRWRQLLDNPLNLPPNEILCFGNGRAWVTPKTMTRLRRERPNLKETWGQVREQAKAEYEQITQQTGEQVRQWGEGAKGLKERLAEQAEVLKQQAAERAQQLREQVAEQAQELGQQVGEQAQGLGENLSQGLGQGLGQSLSKNWGEQYQQVQRRARDFVEELPPLELGKSDLGYRPEYGSGRDRVPDDFPDELTWVDEAGELPPAKADRSQPGDHRESAVPPGDRVPSRDNPWGYADQATASDWETFAASEPDPEDDDPWI